MAIRPRGHRLVVLGGLSYSDWLSMVAGLDLRYKLNETGGLVALALNPAVALGRELVLDTGFDDPTKWNLTVFGTSWSIAAGIASYSGVDAVAGMSALTVPFRAGMTGIISFTVSNAATNSASVAFTAGTGAAGDVLVSQTTYANGIHNLPVTVPGTYTGATGLLIFGYNTGDTFDLDDVSFKQTNIIASSAYSTPGDNPLDLTNTGLAPGQPGAGNLQYVYTGDGTTGRLYYLTIAEYNSMINVAAGGLIASVSASTWAAGIDVFHHSGVDATNFIEMRRNGAVLEVEYQVGGVGSVASFDTSTLPGGSPTTLFNFDIRWTAPGTIDLFYNGVQRDSTAIAAAIVGNLVPALTAWFAANSSGGNSWSGSGGELGLSTIAQSDSFYSEKHQRSGL